MEGPPPVNPDTYRLIGALVGATSGLLFLWPKTLRDAVVRFLFSTFFGFGFYFVPIQLLNWADVKAVPYQDLVTGGALLVGFLAWPVAGFIIRKAGERIAG